MLIPGATNLSAASGNVAAAAATATLTGAAGRFTYLTGFWVGGGGATAASVILVTITGLLGGTQTYPMGVVAGATLNTPGVSMVFSDPLQSSAVNTNIVVSAASFGAGNTNAAAVAVGFLL